MSVLLEVRETEGPSIFEGIIQQPGPFYINNPSSYIWGNSPRLSHWHDSTYINSCLSGSLTSSPSLPSGSVAPKKFGEKVANTAWGSDNNQRGASATRNVAQQSVCQKTHVSETEERSLFSSSICSLDSEYCFKSNPDSSRSNCLKGLDGLDIPISRLSQAQAVNNGLHGKFEEGSKRLIFEASAKAFVDCEEQERTVNGMCRGIANHLTSSCDKHVEADRKSETQCLTVPQVSPFHSASLHSCTSVASTISSDIVQQQAAAGQCVIVSDDNNAFVSVEQTANRAVYGFPSLASAAMDSNSSDLLREGNNVFVFGASGPSRTSVNAKASMQKAGYTGGGHKGKSKKARSSMKGRGPEIQRAPDFTRKLFPADGGLELPMQPSCQDSSLPHKCPDFATCSAGSCLESKAGIYHFNTQPAPNHRIGKGKPAESSQDGCKEHISSLANDKCYINSSMEWRTSFKLVGTSDCKISELFPEINSNSSSKMEESGPLPRCGEAEKPAVADRIDYGTIHDIENSVPLFLESVREVHKPKVAMKIGEQISNTDSKEVQMTNTIINPGSNMGSQHMEPPFVFGSLGNSDFVFTTRQKDPFVADDEGGAVRPSLGDAKLTKKFPKGDHAVKKTKDSVPHEQPQGSGDPVTVKIENSNRVGSVNLAHIGPFTACSGVLFAEYSSNSNAGNAERPASMTKECSDPVCSESILNWADSCQSSSLGHCFVFQGSESGAPGKSRKAKKKLQRSLNLPKINRRSVLKQNTSSECQRRLNADVMKMKAGVSINFSSCNKESSQTLKGSSNGVNLEDTSLCQEDLPSASMTKETGKWCMHGFECPNVQELRAATAQLSIREEEGKASFKNELGSSGQWQSAFVTSEHSTSKQQEKSELDQTRLSHTEENRQQQSVCHSNSAADGQGTKHFETFTFSAKSPSIMSTSKLCRQARKLQRGMSGGKSQKHSVFRNITRQEVCKTAGLGRLPEVQNVPCQDFVSDSSNSSKTKVNFLVEINHDLLNINKQKTVEEHDIVSPVNLDPPAHCLDSKTASASTLKAEQICERWRLRGNEAYADGDFSKAEECYSHGVRSVSQSETSQSCIRACMLCYSNRAATRMAVGRIREALADCVRAMALDSSFLRVQLRAASCHLSLGETKSAFSIFSALLNDKAVQKSDPKLRTEAMEGIKKCQQADNCFKRAVELSSKFSDLPTALRLLDEALIISPYSEALLEQKAQVLLLLQRHEDVVKLCEQSLPSAERNHNMVTKKQLHQVQKSPLGCSTPHIKIWRCHMSAKALFHLGRLEESLDLLQKQDDAITACSSNMSSSNDSFSQLMSVINDLLHHKTAGNEAFQAGKHAEAVEHYTAALACNGESWLFNAVCFCNRAAASQALGHIADAISDCSRAIALDPLYPKALSRRATLFEMVRDFHGASNDLRRLITVLEGYQLKNQEKLPYKVGDKNTLEQDMKKARRRLVKALEEAKKDYPLDHYLLLGVDISSSVNEIKKAYRRAALKHHPDKAGHFLTRENGGDTSVLKVGEEVCRDAERLFKMIGEAYGVLSDTGKRSQYDMEEEDRKIKAENRARNRASSSKRYGSQNESHGGRYRDRGGGWNRYPHHHQRWQCGPDAAEPDTYARRSNFKSGQRTYRSPGFYTYEV